MAKRNFKSFFPIVLFYIVLNGFFITGKNILNRWGMDQDVLIIGNLMLLLITLVSFFLAQKGLKNPNPHAFVRSVYSGMMIKLFLCVIAVFIYVSLYKTTYNKPALFTCMALYLVYSFMEVSILMKLLRKSPHE
ncbi:MAG TPA: hypothetical protein VJ499_10295 [Flavisolibacter sp.]|nr:hypothetical protein [Flavisolibacter sp.]